MEEIKTSLFVSYKTRRVMELSWEDWRFIPSEYSVEGFWCRQVWELEMTLQFIQRTTEKYG